MKDLQSTLAKLKKQEEFFRAFSDKFEVYDPLDRNTPASNNQAIKTDEFLNLIHTMPFLDGKALCAPLSNSMI